MDPCWSLPLWIPAGVYPFEIPAGVYPFEIPASAGMTKGTRMTKGAGMTTRAGITALVHFAGPLYTFAGFAVKSIYHFANYASTLADSGYFSALYLN